MPSNRPARRAASEWRKIIAEQSQSGQTQIEFCRERGISISAFSNALTRFRRQASFVEVSPVDVAPPRIWEGEVVFPNGMTVRVRG